MGNKDGFYSDVIITAVEGGIGYWSRAYDYKWSDEQPETTSAKIVQTEEAFEAIQAEPIGFFNNYEALDAAVVAEDERLKEFTHMLDVAAVRKAFTLIRSDAEIKYASDEWRKRMRACYVNADADLDANDADMVAQLATLGEIVYG